LGEYRGKPLGSIGNLAALSFHETKNLSCGEGGALVVNDPRFAPRAEILWQKGTDRGRFIRGEVDKYSWVDLGSSYLASDILAAVLLAQVEMRKTIQAKRREIHLRYLGGLGTWARANGVALPFIPAHCQSSYHLFSLLLPSGSAQARLIDHLRMDGINAVFHYQPLHLTPMGRELGGKPGQCPVAESVASRIVRLPFYFDLSPDDQDRVISRINSFLP
jgi:dTDP-4-amino-4,6-dideoxygalactose transaminase